MTVGETYDVMVGTEAGVPEGTTLTVTVTVSTGTAELDPVLLTADNPSGNVSFTAPDVAGTVMVTAMATSRYRRGFPGCDGVRCTDADGGGAGRRGPLVQLTLQLEAPTDCDGGLHLPGDRGGG